MLLILEGFSEVKSRLRKSHQITRSNHSELHTSPHGGNALLVRVGSSVCLVWMQSDAGHEKGANRFMPMVTSQLPCRKV